ncbi:unnamed protein product [Amoebophrya sp. A120]|nr:unnamed protein product [Amoebophrya sp. A120]|eukprot:GSA120T00013985001.1
MFLLRGPPLAALHAKKKNHHRLRLVVVMSLFYFSIVHNFIAFFSIFPSRWQKFLLVQQHDEAQRDNNSTTKFLRAHIALLSASPYFVQATRMLPGRGRRMPGGASSRYAVLIEDGNKHRDTKQNTAENFSPHHKGAAGGVGAGSSVIAKQQDKTLSGAASSSVQHQGGNKEVQDLAAPATSTSGSSAATDQHSAERRWSSSATSTYIPSGMAVMSRNRLRLDLASLRSSSSDPVQQTAPGMTARADSIQPSGTTGTSSSRLLSAAPPNNDKTARTHLQEPPPVSPGRSTRSFTTGGSTRTPGGSSFATSSTRASSPGGLTCVMSSRTPRQDLRTPLSTTRSKMRSDHVQQLVEQTAIVIPSPPPAPRPLPLTASLRPPVGTPPATQGLASSFRGTTTGKIVNNDESEIAYSCKARADVPAQQGPRSVQLRDVVGERTIASVGNMGASSSSSTSTSGPGASSMSGITPTAECGPRTLEPGQQQNNTHIIPAPRTSSFMPTFTQLDDLLNERAHSAGSSSSSASGGIGSSSCGATTPGQLLHDPELQDYNQQVAPVYRTEGKDEWPRDDLPVENPPARVVNKNSTLFASRLKPSDRIQLEQSALAERLRSEFLTPRERTELEEKTAALHLQFLDSLDDFISSRDKQNDHTTTTTATSTGTSTRATNGSSKDHAEQQVEMNETSGGPSGRTSTTGAAGSSSTFLSTTYSNNFSTMKPDARPFPTAYSRLSHMMEDVLASDSPSPMMGSITGLY